MSFWLLVEFVVHFLGVAVHGLVKDSIFSLVFVLLESV